jgi:hypothetical protein
VTIARFINWLSVNQLREMIQIARFEPFTAAFSNNRHQ